MIADMAASSFTARAGKRICAALIAVCTRITAERAKMVV